MILPERRIWLRVADPLWTDPLDPSFAAATGGRWNPPDSFPVLYLNADVGTARMQIDRMAVDQPFTADDLDDDAYLLVAATRPRSQSCADAVSRAGLESLGLPPSYPLSAGGEMVERALCQSIGAEIHEVGSRGVWCISAASPVRSGRELAWFPASARSRARPLWTEGKPFGLWRDATEWSDIGLAAQTDPAP
ncbi:MAG: RES domain-containing protein [Gemmatimonadota bacterium]